MAPHRSSWRNRLHRRARAPVRQPARLGEGRARSRHAAVRCPAAGEERIVGAQLGYHGQASATCPRSAAHLSAPADIVVVGGGMVGACLAALMARRGIVPAGRLVLIESRLPPRPAADDEVDLRVSALSRASERILQACGAWAAIGASRACAYERMSVWDESARPGEPGAIEFD